MTRPPNILLIMADQLAAPALSCYGHPVVRAPHLDRLSRDSLVFDDAYCNFPICAPSRYSMLTGVLPLALQAYDNAAELPSGTPTLAHYLAMQGYQTALCGKMHFVGPDQMHGYEERLVTDIYPSDFSWTPNWNEGALNAPTGLSMRAVIEAGPCVRSLQMDYDDEVHYHAVRKLYDLPRSADERPFFLTVSYTHPHSPFVIGQEYWDRYQDSEIDPPSVPAIGVEELDPWSRWLHYCRGMDLYTVTDAHVRAARRAYYGMIGYLDDRIGELMRVLGETGQDRDTIVMFVSDHGEMLGERGMWFKQTFYEWSCRVPFMIRWPDRIAPGRCDKVVSLVDLMPTLLELAGGAPFRDYASPIDGRSLAPLIADPADADWPDEAISEYTAEGTLVPCRMLRQGRYKYIYTHGHPPQLYDLRADPRELDNLAGRPGHAAAENRLRERALRGWDPDRVDRAVRASQKSRRFVLGASRRQRQQDNWAYEVPSHDKMRYVRAGGGNGAMDTKARARFPFVEPVKPDRPAQAGATPDAEWLIE